MRRSPATPQQHNGNTSSLTAQQPLFKHERDSKKKNKSMLQVWGALILVACLFLAAHMFVALPTDSYSDSPFNDPTDSISPPVNVNAKQGLGKPLLKNQRLALVSSQNKGSNDSNWLAKQTVQGKLGQLQATDEHFAGTATAASHTRQNEGKTVLLETSSAAFPHGSGGAMTTRTQNKNQDPHHVLIDDSDQETYDGQEDASIAGALQVVSPDTDTNADSDADKSAGYKKSINHGTSSETNKIAYAFFLGGVPSLDKEYIPSMRRWDVKKARKDDYRGFLYNILVSVKILRDAGSRADFVLLVHMAEPNAELPHEDVRMLKEQGIKLKYTPPTPEMINEFMTLPFEKFRILDLVEYARVLYLDPDVTPRCNLDYIMNLSMGPDAILKQNFIISIGETPASSKFFMLTPGKGQFLDFVSIIPPRTKDTGVRTGWRAKTGWGFHRTKWVSLATGKGESYSFEGGNSDQGMLYEWTKYVKKSVTMVVGENIENWREISAEESKRMQEGNFEAWQGERPESPFSFITKETMEKNHLLQHSCLAESTENKLRKLYNEPLHFPHGVAPYRDFDQWQIQGADQWQIKGLYPWHVKQAPSPGSTNGDESTLVGNSRWFHVLRQLDQQMQMNLGFTDDVSTRDTQAEANWNYIPKGEDIRFESMWSHGEKALRQWALRLVDTSAGYMSYEPPQLEEEVKNIPSARSLRNQCDCPSTILTDVCSSTKESVPEWLSRRVNYYMSKQRPLCPRAAKHNMHVLIPFHDTSDDNLRRVACSVACQNYPPEKVSILIYDDGSDKPPTTDVCDHDNSVEFQPMAVDTTIIGTSAEAKLKEYAHNSMKPMKEGSLKDSTGMSTICVRAKQRIGSTGSTYWGLLLLDTLTEPNDIVVVADKGEFSTINALEIINDKYINTGALTTYGSTNRESISEPLPSDMLTVRFSPRKKAKPSWRFGPPITFKAHLAKELSLLDFTHKDGFWFLDSANRGYIMRFLELAGPDRIAYVDQPIFQQEVDPDGPATARSKTHDFHLKRIANLDESQRLSVPLHVVMLCPEFTEILNDHLIWLQTQQATKTLKIVLHLLCKETGATTFIKEIVDDFQRKSLSAVTAGVIPVTVDIVERPDEEELNEWTRFSFIYELRRREPLESILFLDSDQYMGSTFVGSMLYTHRPKTVTSIYGRSYPPYLVTGSVDFEDDAGLNLQSILQGGGKKFKSFSYVGHGGSMFDANLWLFTHHPMNLKQKMQGFQVAADVWTAYVMDALLGWEMKRRVVLKAPLYPVSLFRDPVFLKKSIYGDLAEQVVDRLMELSRKMGEMAQLPLESNKKEKSEAFAYLQETWHWNVPRRPVLPLRIPEIEVASLPGVLTPDDTKSDGASAIMENHQPLTQDRKKSKKLDKRAFVCVTGQFSRFELRNKINHLFKPMQDGGFEVDVALVVSNGTAVFTNKKTKKNDTIPFYNDFASATRELMLNKINVVSMDGAYPKLEEPPVTKDYVDFLARSQEKKTYEEQMSRAQNHARIFDSYRRCLKYADKAIEQAREGGNYKTPYYDAYVRIRDDIGLKRKLNPVAVADSFPPPPNSIIVTPCRNWKGMNDRFAVVSPDVARAYFDRPASYFFNNTHIYDPGAVRNPESFLIYSYAIEKIHVLFHPKLKGLCRMYKMSNGDAKFLRDDVDGDKCPRPDPYRPRLFTLYGWTL